MSVLIKGMEMPSCCFACPFREKVDPENIMCIVTREVFEETFAGTIQTRSRGNCPLIPVPPHGRLIDGDALHEELYALEYARENEWLDGVREAQGVDAARVALLDAPTIIPASDKDINVLCKKEGER